MNEPGQPWRYDNPYKAPLMMAPRAGADSRTYLAPRWTRVGARLIDLALFAVVFVPMGLAAFLMVARDVTAALAVLAGIPPAVFMAYQCYLVTTTGQSLAKKWLGLRIVRKDGSPVGFASGVLVREWLVFVLAFVPLIGLLFRCVDAVLLVGDERRCLHDLLAGTIVVTALRPV